MAEFQAIFLSLIKRQVFLKPLDSLSKVRFRWKYIRDRRIAALLTVVVFSVSPAIRLSPDDFNFFSRLKFRLDLLCSDKLFSLKVRLLLPSGFFDRMLRKSVPPFAFMRKTPLPLVFREALGSFSSFTHKGLCAINNP